jgi:hypothetical protein
VLPLLVASASSPFHHPQPLTNAVETVISRYNEPGEYEAWFPDPVFQHFRDPIKRKFSVPDGCNPPGVRWGDVVS